MKNYYTILLILWGPIAICQTDIVNGEYYWNTDPGIGLATSITIASPSDTINETATFNVPAHLPKGQNALVVRYQDEHGVWGSSKTKYFNHNTGLELVTGEYFWDTDPGVGQATSFTVINVVDPITETISVVAPVGLTSGIHALYIRIEDEDGHWSIPKVKYFISTSQIPLTHIEYFWDIDPGFGNATTIPFGHASTMIDETVVLDISALAVGEHSLVVRVRDESGVWSTIRTETFIVTAPIYVDESATGTNTGADWTNAFTSLKDALDATVDTLAYTIRVAEGIYYADEGTGDRDSSFVIKSNTSILAGYPSGGDLDENRDPELFEVILSGDIGTLNDSTDNSYHVIETSGVSNVSVDGVIIERGQANGGGENDNGAGWCNDGRTGESSPSLANCTFRKNYAHESGGAMYNDARGSVGLTLSTYKMCQFADNRARYHGGAIYNYSDVVGGESSPEFTNCVFNNNSNVLHNGGAVFNHGSNGICNSSFTNCTFFGNEGVKGGALANYGKSDVNVINCSFANSSSTQGEHIHNQSSGGTTNTLVINSVFDDLNNDGNIFVFVSGATLDLSYSLIDGPLPTGTIDGGDNILNSDPQYLDPINGDLSLNVNSPATNHGNNSVNNEATDIAGNLRIQNAVIDMGAYEVLTNSCLISFNTFGTCAGGFDLLTGDSIISTFTSLNGNGPFDISVNGNIYTGLTSGDSIAILEEGIDFSGTPPYSYVLELESVSDQGNGCVLNPDTTAYIFNIQGVPQMIADDTDGQFCDGQTVSYSVSPSTLGSYEFFNDLNNNGTVETGESLQSGASGLYSFTASIANPTLNILCVAGSSNCSSTVSFLSATVVANPVASISGAETSGLVDNDDHLCFGDDIALSASGGSTYLWDDNTTSPTSLRTVGVNATYAVTVTSNMGCTDSEIYTPSVDAELTLALVNQENISCFGEVDGSLDVLASGGVGAYSYGIGSGGQAHGLFTNLSLATYAITVSDQNTCSTNQSYTIIEPGVLHISAVVQDEMCFMDSTGSISLTSNGGTPPFNYDIGGNQQASSLFSMLTEGMYATAVEDANGCTDTIYNIVNGFDSLNISIESTSNAMCSGGSNDGSATFSANGGAGAYQYDIGNGYQTSPVFSSLSAGPYTLTVKDGNNCEKTLDFNIGSQSLSATFTYSDNGNYIDKVVTPESGSQYETYRFEINFVDPNNELPAATYPRLFLDFEGNGIYTNINDRIYILSQTDNSDNDVTDGKTYFTEAVGLPISSNWKAYFIALDANGCEATFGPVEVPDVLANPNVSLLASDISFSDVNPDTLSFFNVFATINNTSSFDAENFEVALFNQYSSTFEDTLTIALLEAGQSQSLFWDVQAPNEEAWVPYEVILDVNNEINESNELDNSASKAVVVGDFSLPVDIIFTTGPTLNPQTGYPCTNRSLTGKVVYTGIPGLQDSTVKGAEVTVAYVATGQSYTTYTDNNGNFSLTIYSPVAIGDYSLTGYVTDQTLTAIFSVPDITVIPNPPACALPDLVLGHAVDKTVVNVGDTLSGTFIVQNVGCVATTSPVSIVANFPDANESIGPFTVPVLAIGQQVIYSWSTTYNNEQTAQLFAHVDDDLELEEIEEGNNYTSRTIAVANKSNLKAPSSHTIVLNPSTVAVGGTTTISFPIINSSLVDISEDVEYQLSIGGVSYNSSIVGGIESGENAEASMMVTVPDPSNSDYILTIDPNFEIAEKEEGDNMQMGSFCKDFSVEKVCSPPGELSFWEKTQNLNQFVDLSIGISNSGLIAGSNVEVKFEVMGPGFSGWTLIQTETIPLIKQTCFCPMSVSPSTPFAFSQEGIYQIRITVDENNTHDECDESNNEMIQTVEVLNIPDLRMISAFINPSQLNPNIDEDISINITYDNIGQENVLDTFDLKISVDGIALDSQEVFGLAADDFTTVSLPQTWSSSIVGGHVFEAFIDSGEEIAELSETNNQGTRAIIVGTAPNLYFVDFKSSDTLPDFGDEVLVQAVIGNAGDLDCSAILELFYLDNEGDTIPIGTKNIIVSAGMMNQFSLTYTVLREQSYILGRITPGTPTEYNLVDNEANFVLNAGEGPCNLLVSNANNDGEGSLRQCIECANESDVYKTISFDIPGQGPHVINLLTDLPYVTGDSTQIDGSTQSDNFPMAGEIIIDMTALTGINKTAIIVAAKGVGIYGLRFRNRNLYSNRSAIYYSLGSHGFIIGDSMRGNWFMDDKWQSVVYVKENINYGWIQGNVFESDSMRLQHAITITPGTNNVLIGGDSSWMSNHFVNCTETAIQLRNHSSNNKVINNYFIGNDVAIDNIGTVNSGNLYLGNHFECNTTSIGQNPGGNNGILPPTIIYSNVNFIAGKGDPNAVVEIYISPDTCATAIDCQGSVIHRDTCDASGDFYCTFDSLLTIGNIASAIQTEPSYSGSSKFSTCVPIDSTCVDFVYSCNDDIVGSLRSAIDCAADGDTINFLSYLNGDNMMLEDTLLIDKNITVQGLGNPGLTLVSSYGNYVIRIAANKTVIVRDLRICVNDTGASSILVNYGTTRLDNVTLIDKRTGVQLPTIMNHLSGEVIVESLLETLKE